MPTDLIYATMQGSSLSSVQQLTITYTFSDGQVTLTSGGVTGVYWGTPQTSDPRQWYTFDAGKITFTGNMVNFYAEFWMNCQSNLLTGTIQASQPLPVEVSLGSYAGKGEAILKPGQTVVNFQLPVGNYGLQAGRTPQAQKLLNTTP
jgi:hypothetical protein